MANVLNILTPAMVSARGLEYIGYPLDKQQRMSHNQQGNEFHAHYGSSAHDLSLLWHDLQTTTIAAAWLTPKERAFAGFKMYMASHYFLWTNPKNASILASRFGICIRYIRSETFWKWIRKIAAMKAIKIVWDPRFNNPDYQIYILSMDGVDFTVTEKPNDRLNIDPGMYSYKSNSAGLRYLIGLSLWDSKAVFIDGPYKPGERVDLSIWRNNLKNLMANCPGKMGIGDSGFQTSEPDERGMIAVKRTIDTAALKRFKSRILARHETYNKRLKDYKILADVFKFTAEKHKLCFEAINVILHYKMESSEPLFDV